ncbi:MAG TPA: xanthine dehydrogenase family protein molybdopterin-binding subunit [Solirubrobacterales bacterium]|nr:xanthine dehydrogenase family protein molybdopterin-binding subunit [Solirubrobacterales bacterium]
MSGAIGRPVDRVDGRQKVTGQARYTAEIALPGLTHAALVCAPIPSGTVTGIDASAALAAEGVIAVLTAADMPRIANEPRLLPSLVGGPAPGISFFPMQDDEVHYAGQPVAIVVAATHEAAAWGADLVAVGYDRAPSITTIEEGREAAVEPEKLFGGLMPARNERGDVEAGLAEADVRVDLSYKMAANHHNPIEPPATTAAWEGERLTIWDSTMGVRATQLTVSHLLGTPLARIRVITHFVGGAFGMKAMVWPHVTLTAMAAGIVRRPLRLALTRPQMFYSNGHREEQEQRITIGAKRDGRLTAIRHHKLSITSRFDDWAEPATGGSSEMYGVENYEGVHRLIHGNTTTPTFTRGPGETLGSYVLETALDELAEQLGIDPIELRIKLHPPVDSRGNRWTSDGLAECLRTGAERFGWSERGREPRSVRDGDWLIGTGVAAAGYPVAPFMPSQHARARLYADGSALVETSTQEFGTGVATMMTQVGADAIGVPLEAVTAGLGDTDLPNTSSAVGSAGATMVSASVHNAGTALREKLVGLAVGDEASPLHGFEPADVEVADGRLSRRGDPATGEAFGELLERNRMSYAEAEGSWSPPPFEAPLGLLTFGAQFVEVAVDPELGLVRVRRMVGAFAPGRVLNPKLARSQLIGGMLWGLGQALLEGNAMDPRHGRWAAQNLGEYLVPVNADAPDVVVEFVEVEDEGFNPLGVKGVGEIGQVGVAAAITNAVHNATGRRFHQLPLAAELVMEPAPAAPPAPASG